MCLLFLLWTVDIERYIGGGRAQLEYARRGAMWLPSCYADVRLARAVLFTADVKAKLFTMTSPTGTTAAVQ